MSDLDDLLKNLDHIPDLTLAECNAFIPLLDSLLIELAYVSHIEKAARDPLTEKGFIALEQLLANKLDKLSYNEKRKALRRIAAAAKVTDFSALTAEKQAEFIGLVQNTFRDYGLATSKLISGQITDSMLDMFKRTRTVMSKDLPIEDFFTVQDTRAIGYMANTQSFWIRQHFQNDKTQAMNDVVAKQLEQFGGSREDVADALIARLGRDLGDKNYWTVVSSATLNTSRSYSSLRAYQDAGIQRYEIVAMMDERTSSVCFRSGTKVSALIDNANTQVNIECIKPGDVVLSGSGMYNLVCDVTKRGNEAWVRLRMKSGAVIECTKEHPILTKSGWLHAQHINPGQTVYRQDKELQELRNPIQSIQVRKNKLQQRMQLKLQESIKNRKIRAFGRRVCKGLGVRWVPKAIFFFVERWSAKKVLLSRMLQTEARRFLGGKKMQALQSGVYSSEALRRQGPVHLLRREMQDERVKGWTKRRRAYTGLRDLWKKVQDKTTGISSGKRKTELLYCVPKKKNKIFVRILRERNRISSIWPKKVLFNPVLQKIFSPFQARNSHCGNTARLRDRVRKRIQGWSLFRGLFSAKVESSNRDRRALLAQAKRPELCGERRKEKQSDIESWINAVKNNRHSNERGQRPGEIDYNFYISSASGTDEIESVEFFTSSEPCFNLTVENDPTYVANGLIVHNCRNVMNGRVFEVSVALEVFSKLQSAESPEKYKEIKPWSSEFMTDEGTVAYKAGNFRFDDSVTDAALAKHNFTFPPFHGRCRTRVVAEFIQKYFIMKNCR